MNETLFHPSTFPYLSCKLLLEKTKSPKIASWPGILTSDKETRTKVVLARKLGKQGLGSSPGRNVISEDELLNEIPQNSDVVIWLKIRVEKGTYYNIRTDSTYKGKKMPCAGCRGKLCLYEVSKAQAVTRPGRLDSFKNYYPHKCIFMSSVSSVEINP